MNSFVNICLLKAEWNLHDLYNHFDMVFCIHYQFTPIGSDV